MPPARSGPSEAEFFRADPFPHAEARDYGDFRKTRRIFFARSRRRPPALPCVPPRPEFGGDSIETAVTPRVRYAGRCPAAIACAPAGFPQAGVVSMYVGVKKRKQRAARALAALQDETVSKMFALSPRPPANPADQTHAQAAQQQRTGDGNRCLTKH